MLFISNARAARWLLIPVSAFALGASIGCSKDEGKGKSAKMVVVSAEGGKIDPAVPKSRVPHGAWMCDMGTVHYARSEKGDGVCPLCGMLLVESGAAVKRAAPAVKKEAAPAVKEEAPAAKEEAAPAAKEEAAAATDGGAHPGHGHRH